MLHMTNILNELIHCYIEYKQFKTATMNIHAQETFPRQALLKR